MKNKLLLSSVATCVLISSALNAQVTSPTNFATPPPQYVGWSGAVFSTSKPLDLKNGFNNQPINFFTNNSGTNGVANAIQRMTILGTTGFVGVGTTAAPSQKFEVEAGNINLFTSTNAYMIGSQNILWHKGNARNIFVGVGAGANHVGGASNNSYVGYNAGFSGGGGLINDENTIFGADAGFSNTARAHVFVGYRTANAQSAINSIGLTMVGAFAGEFGTGNGESVFVGYKAGRNTNSSSNTFVGFLSGENNTGGGANSFFGYNSGNNNGTHTDNTYLGGGSGVFSNGNNNTCVGRSSGASGVGNSNVLLGYFAMQLANSGDENVIIGSKANSSTSGNNYNTMVGTQAGLINTTGAKNTFIGYKTAINQTTGDNNAYLGTNTGNNIATGSNNTFLGGNADATNVSSNLTNASAIGSNAKVTNNNHMILGDNSVNVGIGLSADATGPQNKLEINTAATSVIPGTSGLRFRDLTSGSNSITNPGTGVLSVDINGDVIYVQGAGGNGFGNICGALTTQPLLNNWEIPMNGKNYTFSDPPTLNYGENTVRIGAACNNPVFNAKLEVIRNVNIIPSTIHTLIGVGSVNSDNFPTLIVGDKSYAGYFLSDGGSSVAPTNYSNYGVVGIAKDARVNYGGYFEAKGPSLMGYGIYAKANSTTPGAGPLAGYFNGDVVVNGPYSGYSNQIFSDKNIKTGVVSLKTSMDIINKLRPVSFKYDNSYAPQVRVDNNLTYGFIAQEVGDVIPELVRNIDIPEELDSLGNIINPTKTLSTLNYDGLIPFAIGGIQELNVKQREMQATLDKAGLSDAQVKTNVNTFNALTTVKTLSPVKYNFTNANVPQLNFKPNTDYGFIAQQLETVYPELVDTIRIDATYDSLGVVVNPSKVLKTVNYKAMSALLVRSIQEQQLTIDSLRNVQSKQDSINQAVQQQLAALASQISSCCSNASARNANSNINQLDVELSDKDAIVLNQNVPNPFAEQTTITYNVPTSVEKAQLIFFNANGQVIQTVDIKTRGKGKVNVFATDLSSGLYHYTLVADGKVVDSKKMVRE